MIKRPDQLAAIERQYSRERLASLTYADGPRIFTALWREAVTLNPMLGEAWQDDLVPDLAVARALNGLPPDA